MVEEARSCFNIATCNVKVSKNHDIKKYIESPQRRLSFVTWRSAINNQKLCKTKASRIDFPVEKIKRTNFTHVSLLIIMFLCRS